MTTIKKKTIIIIRIWEDGQKEWDGI